MEYIAVTTHICIYAVHIYLNTKHTNMWIMLKEIEYKSIMKKEKNHANTSF